MYWLAHSISGSHASNIQLTMLHAIKTHKTTESRSDRGVSGEP